MQKLYTVKEIAELLQMHEQTIYRLISKGELESINIGANKRVSQEQLDKFLNQDKE